MASFVIKTILILSLIFQVCACSIHPSIQDVTSYDAADVVRKIRCEARQVLIQNLALWLSTRADDSAARALAMRIRPDLDIKPALANLTALNRQTREKIDFFAGSAIAYDFTLNITEKNSAGGGLNLLNTFSAGSLGYGFSLGLDLTRQNINSFLITDSFQNLLTGVPQEYCSAGWSDKTKNYIYPIIGNIGLSRVFSEFFTLSLFGNLAAGEIDGPATTSHGLEFTTKWSGSTSPSLEFTPAAGLDIALKSASLTGSASREDKHKVTIGLSIPVRQFGPLAERFTAQLVNASRATTPAERQAAEAVSRHILRFELGRRENPAIIIQPLFPFF